MTEDSKGVRILAAPRTRPLPLATAAAAALSLHLPWTLVTSPTGSGYGGAPVIPFLGLGVSIVLVPAAILALAGALSHSAMRFATGLLVPLWLLISLTLVAPSVLGGSSISATTVVAGYVSFSIATALSVLDAFGIAALLARARSSAVRHQS